MGTLKAKLAKYRQELIDIKTAGSGGGSKGEGFDVMKSGDARAALIGFPSVGKSTLLGKITGTASAAAAYEFTTLTTIPGNIHYEGATIQLLDLPGIIEGASQGRGRGRQVIAVARTSDLIVMMLDATKGTVQKALLEAELEAVGIRLNQQPPACSFRVKSTGGIGYTSTCRQSLIDERMVQAVLKEYKIHNCELIIRQPDMTVDQLIDVVVGNRRYIPCLYVYNKIDSITIPEVNRLARQPCSVVISCELGGDGLNLDYLVERMWRALRLQRVYTKKRGEYPDFADGIVLRSGATIEHVCHAIHRNLIGEFKYALVWVRSVQKFYNLPF